MERRIRICRVVFCWSLRGSDYASYMDYSDIHRPGLMVYESPDKPPDKPKAMDATFPLPFQRDVSSPGGSFSAQCFLRLQFLPLPFRCVFFFKYWLYLKDPEGLLEMFFGLLKQI